MAESTVSGPGKALESPKQALPSVETPQTGAQVRVPSTTVDPPPPIAINLPEKERYALVEVSHPGQVLKSPKRIFYRRVFEIMYIAASKEPAQPEQTRNEKCIDCCCFEAINCDLKNRCKRSMGNNNVVPVEVPGVKEIKKMSPLLRRGRSKGCVIHTEMIFPLVRE